MHLGLVGVIPQFRTGHKGSWALRAAVKCCCSSINNCTSFFSMLFSCSRHSYAWLENISKATSTTSTSMCILCFPTCAHRQRKNPHGSSANKQILYHYHMFCIMYILQTSCSSSALWVCLFLLLCAATRFFSLLFNLFSSSSEL